ncbi:hypothetical protein GRI40_03615 [Altererythrobacter aerius]|uniref:DUF1214 domain-containing protein n=1 Tax=Tsuneonella aeria TaxID=1837929 RepID=A0A6I4TAG9_9SPHN|nr:hypothetical protein [Tsuneonella aeria]MXO74311.1 hypothetical protein [Tsuneonella aeria]
MNGRERLLAGAAWDDFCDSLKAAGRIVDAFGEDANELDRAEWYRFLGRLTRNGLERFLENCEPDNPRLRDTPWRQSINFQSPDQDHLLAEFVDGSHDYVIRGNRGGLPYFVIASWNSTQPRHPGDRAWAADGVAGLTRFDPTAYQTTGFITSDQVHFDDDGHFTIAVSQTPIEGIADWLPIQPDCVGLLVRTLYHDRANTAAPQFAIERIDSPAPRAVTPGEVADGLAKAGQTVLGYGELVRRWWQANLGQRPNRIRFDRAVYFSNGGVPDRHHGFGAWECQPDEALVIDFMPSACDYWIFQLCSIWQENLDNYEQGDGYVTKYTARLNADGSVRIIVTGTDPGICGNVISPFGHVHGGMSLRLIGTRGAPPAVSLRRVPLAQLAAHGESALAAIEPILSGEVAE